MSSNHRALSALFRVLAVLGASLLAASGPAAQTILFNERQRDFLAGLNPIQSAIGDFNRDGIPDVAVTSGAQIYIFLGNGAGGFQPRLSYPIPPNHQAAEIAVGDVNGDGKLDLVFTAMPSEIYVALGNGDGTFQPPLAPHPSLIADLDLCPITLGDLNGDGKLDLVVPNLGESKGAIHVLFGNGDGTFQRPVVIGKEYAGGQVVIGDFNSDGLPDLAALSGSTDAVTAVHVLPGDGKGNFGPPISTPIFFLIAGINPPVVNLVAADFNGDGKLDLAAANYDNPFAVYLLAGAGDGTFQVSPISPGGSPPGIVPGRVTTIAAADVNGDGKPDLVVTGGHPNTNNAGDVVSIMLNLGNAVFQPIRGQATGGFGVSIGVADFNKDGHPDIVTLNTLTTNGVAGSHTISLLLGNGDGTLQGPPRLAGLSPKATSIASADFNNDGNYDLAAADFDRNAVQVRLGSGSARFSPPAAFPAGKHPYHILAADLNGDGIPDLLTDSFPDQIAVLHGNGDGTFAAPVNFLLGRNPKGLLSGDFHGNGRPDLAAIIGVDYSYTPSLVLLPNDGSGGFLPPKVVLAYRNQAAQAGYLLTAADFNGDGKLDLSILGGDPLYVFFGNGDGTFQSPVTSNTPQKAEIWSSVAADVNHDGKPDLVAEEGPELSVRLGNGDGTFQSPRYFPGLLFLDSRISVADINGDGNLDVVAVVPLFNEMYVFAGDGAGGFSPPSIFATDETPFQAAIQDFNHDGKPDVAIVNSGSGDINVLFNVTP